MENNNGQDGVHAETPTLAADSERDNATRTEQEHVYDLLFKVTVIGDSGVGKTCLVMRFAEDEYENDHISTIGIDFKLRKVDFEQKRIKLCIWDTSGQERFKSLMRSYYRGSQGIFVVYDVTNQESFSKVKFWLQEVERHASDIPVKILVGNKCDLTNKRSVNYRTAKAFADELHMPFFETSAKSATNVEQAFMTMVTKMKENMRSDCSLCQKSKISIAVKKCGQTCLPC